MDKNKFIYVDTLDEIRYRPKGWTDGFLTKVVRSVHVYHGSDLIGRIIQNVLSDGEKDKAFVVERASRKYGGFESLEYRSKYAATVLEAKKHSEWLLESWTTDKKSSKFVPQRKLLAAANLTYGGNEDFYPTPMAVAGRMLAKVRWNDVETILEPSAGKGDLLDALMTFAEVHKYDLDYNFVPHTKSGKQKSLDHRLWGKDPEKTAKLVDVIEIDPNLRDMLKGKGYRIVGDDFLAYHTHKKYDAIIMNPPFSNGAEHLLHALDLLKSTGGQIVCLLNAETVRNPYSRERQLLLQILGKYGATFEYIKDGFKKAERRTDVEVVIVNVTIPEPAARSRIWEYMEKAKAYSGDESPTALALKGDWVHALIQTYNFEAEAGKRLLREFQGYRAYELPGTADTPSLIGVTIDDHEVSPGNEGINKFLEKLRLKYWNKLMFDARLEQTVGKMTSDIHREYSSRVREMRDCEFNEFNIRQLILDIGSQLNAGLSDAIIKLFDTLSGKFAWLPECKQRVHYWNAWKTNKAEKVGMRAILPIDGFHSHWSGKKDHLEAYKIYQELSDLEKVMDFLDRGQTSSRTNLYNRAEDAVKKDMTAFDTTYFSATFYKKGTCHIKFHDDARHIVDRLNIYAAMNRGWLPPFYGKVRYEDMDAEAKAAVDSFHEESTDEKGGKYQLPAYEEIVKNSSSYLPEAPKGLKLLGA